MEGELSHILGGAMGLGPTPLPMHVLLASGDDIRQACMEWKEEVAFPAPGDMPLGEARRFKPQKAARTYLGVKLGYAKPNPSPQDPYQRYGRHNWWEAAHRLVMLAIWGPPRLPRPPPPAVSPRWVCMHLCGNPRCLNPLHLAWGSYQQNHATQPLPTVAADARATRGRWLAEHVVQQARASPRAASPRGAACPRPRRGSRTHSHPPPETAPPDQRPTASGGCDLAQQLDGLDLGCRASGGPRAGSTAS